MKLHKFEEIFYSIKTAAKEGRVTTPADIRRHGGRPFYSSYETSGGRNSEQIERRTSNVQLRTSNIDGAALYLF